MAEPSHRVVVVDTNVWSHLYTRTQRQMAPAAKEWREQLMGHTVVIAAQTRSEVLFGALVADWGECRTDEIDRRLAEFSVLPVTPEVVQAHAQVRAACRRVGHPLAQKGHVGDAWIAASAIAFNFPLLSRDAIFTGVPGLVIL